MHIRAAKRARDFIPRSAGEAFRAAIARKRTAIARAERREIESPRAFDAGRFFEIRASFGPGLSTLPRLPSASR